MLIDYIQYNEMVIMMFEDCLDNIVATLLVHSKSNYNMQLYTWVEAYCMIFIRLICPLGNWMQLAEPFPEWLGHKAVTARLVIIGSFAKV